MTSIQTYLIYDERVKESWGKGAWEKEHDCVTWTDPTTQLPCIVYRTEMGTLNGYVGIALGNVLHGVTDDSAVFGKVNVHGGLTFSGQFTKEHIPVEDESIWWFGFDCAHAYDVIPALYTMRPSLRNISAVYRDADFVSEQVRSLASQIAKINYQQSQKMLKIGKKTE